MATLIAGKYEVLTKLGQGGMGAVYKVRHVELDELFALKALPDHLADDADRVMRFRREAQRMARFRHEHIVRVFDFGRDGDLFYLVLEFIDGPTLGDYLRERSGLAVAEALEVARQIASALEYAHAGGVTHRDVKPSNVLIQKTQPLHALLIDFGIAKVNDPGERTRTDVLVGTYRYSSPEQLGLRDGEHRVPVGPPSDVFALGLVLYEALEGRALFADLDGPEIVGRLVYNNEPLQPMFSRPVPDQVRALIRRATCRHPSQRYPSMGEMLRDIEVCLRGTVPSRSASRGGAAAEAAFIGGRSYVANVANVADGADIVEVTDVADIDARIQQLEREKHRRLAQTASAKAEVARQRAEGVGARNLVPEAYDDAMAESERGRAALEAEEYTRGAELFDAAAAEFDEATAQARVRRQQREAERLREKMGLAREHADSAAAAALVQTLYQQANAAAAAGDAEFARAAWDAARHGFAEAGRLYEEAAAAARQRRRQAEAEDARGQTLRAREAADAVGAADLAGEIYEQARTAEAEARVGLERDAFDEAQRAFVDAARLYDEAAAVAARRRRQQEAESVHGRMATARAEAEQAGASADAAGLYEKARAAEAAGDDAQAQGAYEDAGRAYESACGLYGQAAGQARRVQEQRRDAEGMRDAARAKRAVAAAVQAPESAANLYQQAVVAEARGDVAVARDAHEEARHAYDEAGRLYEQAAAEARERQRAALRGRAEAARDDANRALADAERADVARHAADLYEEGLRQHREGVAALTTEAEAPAIERFVEAAETLRTAAARAREAAAAAERARQAEQEREEARARESARAKEAAKAKEAAAERARQRERAKQEARARDAARAKEAARAQDEAARAARERESARARDAADAAYRVKEIARADRAAQALALEDDVTVVTDPSDAGGATIAAPLATIPAPPGTSGHDATLGGLDPDSVPSAALLPVGIAMPGRADVADDGATTIVRIPVSKEKGAPRPSVYVGIAAAAIVAGGAGYFALAPDRPRLPDARVASPGGAPAAAVKPVGPVEKPAAPSGLAWERIVPNDTELRVRKGASVVFESIVAGEQELGAALEYVWSLDGEAQVRGRSWTYAVPEADIGKTRDVVVIARHGAEQIERHWQLHVDPANAAPTIASTTPTGAVVQVEEGTQPTFSITVTDPDLEHGDTLTYVWERNGTRLPSASSASLTLPDPRDGDRVRVTVTDADGLSAGARTWQVALAPAAPAIVGMSPRADRLVRLVEGGSVEFTLNIKAPTGVEAQVRWYLDDEEVGQGDRWRFAAPLIDSGRVGHRVRAEVVDERSLKGRPVRWDVEITGMRPRISRVAPDGPKLSLEPGETAEFEAQAGSERENVTLEYEWRLDGGAPVRASAGQFRLPAALDPGEHVVEVASVDSRGVRSDAIRWAVQVRRQGEAGEAQETKPAEAARAEAASAPAAPTQVAAAPGNLTEAEIQDWFARLDRAIESGDAQTLQEMGAVRADQVDAFLEMWRSFDHLKVDIAIEAMKVEGRQATVTFNRRDTDERGKKLSHPRQTFTLVKGETGAVRRQ